MKVDKKIVVTALTFLLIGIIGTTIVWVYASPSSQFIISGGIYPEGTYTVWKEGSLYYSKHESGLIPTWGDGSTNFSLVMNNAVGEDRKVIIKAGDYYTNAPVNCSYHGLTIEGEGKYATTIYATKDLGETIYDKPSGIFYIGYATGTTLSHGVRIAHLGLNGQGHHMPHLLWFDKAEESIAENLYVTNANTSNCGGFIDMGSACWRTVITECVARNGDNGFANEGFFHTHASVSTISNCLTYGGYENQPAIKGGEFGSTIIGNIVHYPYLGIQAQSKGFPNVVSGNYIYQAREKSIVCQSTRNESIISNNIIYKGNDTAIDVRGENIIVSNNHIWNISGSLNKGIVALGDNIQILGNHLHGINSIAIEVEDHSYNIVSNNLVYDVGQGIVLEDSSNCTVNGNIVYESNNNGIKIWDTNFTIVSNNRIIHCGNEGILESGGNTDYNAYVGDFVTGCGTNTITLAGANSEKHSCFEGNSWVT